jgi:hypothetical protein
VYIRPKCSWIRFEAQLPNQCWQADVTQWRLGDSTEVEICVFLDDYSRLVTAAQMFTVTTAAAVARLFRKGARTWGLPASVLTDNGCVFTPWHRGGATALRSRTARSGYRTQTLPSLPSPNLRQGGTVPSDPSNASSPNNRHPKPSPIRKPRSTGSSPNYNQRTLNRPERHDCALPRRKRGGVGTTDAVRRFTEAPPRTGNQPALRFRAHRRVKSTASSLVYGRRVGSIHPQT